MGHFGIDFKNYKDFKKFRKKSFYKDIADKLNALPSQKCVSCRHLKSCYGGCPITWKNFSFEDIEKLKNLNND
jgi:radical SAM protein with 4Fe4S-binding SPASM domain